MRFLLYKDGDGNHPTYTDPASYVAEFPIPSARRKHGGSYTCRYSHRTGPTRYSEPSDPVQIIVADPSLPRPSISLSPTGVTAPGADVTIRCQGQRRDVRFFLHKAGDLNPPRHMDPAGDGAEFHIPTVGRQHGGSYGCSYRPRSEPFVSSQPSHPVQLVVADPTLPKPSVSVRPSRGFATQEPVAMSYPSDPSLLGVRDYTGGNIVRLALSAGVLLALALILAKAAHSWRRGGRVSRRDARSYSCGYCTKSDPPVWSEPSDPEELVVPGAAAPLDFTNANIARLVLGTVVLLILGLSWI
ncbi:unnamed protein product [Caretta caretta]